MSSWLRQQAERMGLGPHPGHSVQVNQNKAFQSIVGFGGSTAYYTNWVYHHPNRDLIYRSIFEWLMPSLLRFRNTYALNPNGPAIPEEMKIDAYTLTAARRTLGVEPLVLLTSWSPPANLKSTGTLGSGTLVSSGGRFRYDLFASWWLASVQAYRAVGVNPRWISIQNEPDYVATTHDACNFRFGESRTLPCYDQALRATYGLFQRNLPNPPGFVGPEHTGINGCLPPDDTMIALEAVGNHMYSSGEFKTPETMIPSLKEAGTWTKRYGTRPLFMTEFGNLTSHAFRDPLHLAKNIHNALVHASVSAYWHWDLFWGAGSGEGSLVLIDNPFTGNRNNWANEQGFTLTQSFWYFCHFSRFIRPGFVRVDVSSSNPSVLASAYAGPRNKASIVLINDSENSTTLSINGLPAGPAVVFQSTLTNKMRNLGRLRDLGTGSYPLELPANSITTVVAN